MDALWRWIKPADKTDTSSDEGTDNGASQDIAAAGRGANTRLDQLALQAYTYASSHPEFLDELEEAGRLAEPEQDALPAKAGRGLSAAGLSRQLDALLKPSLPVTPESTSKMVLLAQGKLTWEDPAAACRLVLDWVPEENQRQVKRQQRRQQQLELQQRRRQKAEQQGQQGLQQQGVRQSEASSEASEDDQAWLAHYELHAATLAQWEEADAIGKRPLPRKSKQAHLITHSGQEGRVPAYWLEASRRPVTAAGKHQLWRLPWVV